MQTSISVDFMNIHDLRIIDILHKLAYLCFRLCEAEEEINKRE